MTSSRQAGSTDIGAAHQDRPGPAGAPRPGPLGRLGGLAFRRRGTVLIAWGVVLALAFGLSAAFGGEFTNASAAPGTDSAQAQSLLGERFPAQSGDTVRVVVRADDVASAEVRATVTALLGELAGLPHVASVEDPYATPGTIAPRNASLT